MRALLLFALTGCHAILGDYELGTADSGTDTAAVDTAVADTAVTDTGMKARSCKDEKAAGKTSDGPILILEPDIRAFCDLSREGGGWTLVAMRASNTDGSKWSGEPAGLRTKAIDRPDDNDDMVLNIDWRLLDFSEVRYELGLDLGGPMPRYGEVATFSMLDEGKKGGARDALSRHVKGGERPPCTIDGTSYPNCFGMVAMPPGDPMQSYGWVYSPDTKTVCYWAQVGMTGSPGCKTGKVGAARVWVR